MKNPVPAHVTTLAICEAPLLANDHKKNKKHLENGLLHVLYQPSDPPVLVSTPLL